ncbi:MAG: hypothetical protein STSR0009_13220 [Methanoregula sp.]
MEEALRKSTEQYRAVIEDQTGSSSVYLLPDAVSSQIDSVRLLSFCVVFRASHDTVTSDDCRTRNTPNG